MLFGGAAGWSVIVIGLFRIVGVEEIAVGRSRAIVGYSSIAAVLLFACGRGSSPSLDTGQAVDSGDVALGPPVESTDVVVVGGGIAGLTAAIQVDLAGAAVIVLEREEEVGGAAAWAEMMLFSGTDVQEAEGVYDSAQMLLDEWAVFTGRTPEDPWVVQFAEDNVEAVYDWLTGFGVEFTLFPEPFFAGGETRRVHTVASESLHPLSAVVARVEEDWIRLEHEAVGLVTEGSRVIGVQFDDHGSGESGWIEARCVVMATGGFLRDHDRVRKERPDLEQVDFWNGSGTGSDGSGLTLVEAVGGSTERLDLIGLYLHGTADPRKGSEGEDIVVSELNTGVWVNTYGHRFFNESEANSFRPAEAAIVQPQSQVWLIVDSSEPIAFSDPYVQSHEKTDVVLEDVIAYGFAAEQETLLELGAAIGVDPLGLDQTVSAFNEYANGEVLKDPWRDGLGAGKALEIPPFVAIRLVPVAAKAFGGVDVDLEGRVIDVEGQSIPGLFAAGELTGMAGGSLVNEWGFAGSLTAVILSARHAGDAAGDEALEVRR